MLAPIGKGGRAARWRPGEQRDQSKPLVDGDDPVGPEPAAGASGAGAGGRCASAGRGAAIIQRRTVVAKRWLGSSNSARSSPRTGAPSRDGRLRQGVDQDRRDHRHQADGDHRGKLPAPVVPQRSQRQVDLAAARLGVLDPLPDVTPLPLPELDLGGGHPARPPRADAAGSAGAAARVSVPTAGTWSRRSPPSAWPPHRPVAEHRHGEPDLAAPAALRQLVTRLVAVAADRTGPWPCGSHARASSTSRGAEGLAALLPEWSSAASTRWRSAHVTHWDL